MTRPERLSVCYVDPGRDFCPGSSRTRHVLTLARALARDVDVSVVFRRLGADPDGAGCPVSALESGAAAPDRMGVARRSLGRFLERRAGDFDLIIDAGWPVPGKLSAWCAQRRMPAIPVLDWIPEGGWLNPVQSGVPWLGVVSSGRYLRRAPVVVAGSPAVREAMANRWRVDPARVVVIGPAVDRTLFSPGNQVEARRRLGMDPAHRVIVVGDGLGRGADLTPLVEAVPRTGDPALRLHVLADGERLDALKRLAGPGPAIQFHGAVSDQLLAEYLAAADLCVLLDQPRDPSFTLLECSSAGRPVVIGVAAGRPTGLALRPVSGFLVEHDLLSWIRFLQRDCPSRNSLRMMGLAASSTPIEHAERAAAAYQAVIDRALAASGRESALA